MKRYPKYKDSGVKWLGEVPEHWDVKPFGRFFSYGKGLPITKANLKEEGIAVISYGQIHAKINTGISLSEELTRRVSPDYLQTHPQCLLQPNDFVFADTSEDVEGAGNCTFNDYPEPIFAGYHTLVVRPKDLPFPKYYACLFQSTAWKNQIRTLVNGVKVYSITRGMLKKSYLLFPPLQEQQAIVEYIGAKTRKIHAYIAEREKELNLLAELKQSKIAEVVTHGLNPHAPMKDSGIAWTGLIPEHWEIKRVAALFSNDIATNSDFAYRRAFKFNYGTLVPKNEVAAEEEYRDTYIKYSVLRKDDIVLNGLNLNYDFISQRVAIAPADGIITSAYIVARPRKTTFADYYLYLLKTMDNMKLFHGMGTGIRLTLSFDELKKQMLPFPPIEEQRAIVDFINTKCDQINCMISKIETEIAHLKEYKQRMIDDAVTGKICVQ